ncbi:MAG: hypothetical protein IJ073_02285, partial [Lachnospiraceae bacterium]|nr:hypothetical protein [Lachnospiraceae bacterium]
MFHFSFILVVMLCAAMLFGCSEEKEDTTKETVAAVSEEAEIAEEEKISPQIDVSVDKQEPIEAIVDDNPDQVVDDDPGDNSDSDGGEGNGDGEHSLSEGTDAPQEALEAG